MESSLLGFFTSLGQSQFNTISTFVIIALVIYSVNTRQYHREGMLHSEKNDIKHDKNIEILRQEMQTLKHELLEKISDNGTLFEKQLKQHLQELMKARQP